MPVCHSCDLRQMRNTDHLVFFSDQCHFFRNLLSSTSTDPDIDLIKDQRLDLIFVCHYRFDRQHNSGKFPAGCHFCQRLHRLSLIKRDPEFHIIDAIFGIFFLFRKMYLKLYLFKIQIFKTFLNLFFKHFSLLLPQCRKLSCQFQILLRQLLTGFLQFLHISIIIFQNPDSFFLLLTVCHDLFIRIPILCLQMIDLIQPLFCLIEFFIREFTVFLIFCQFMIKII